MTIKKSSTFKVSILPGVSRRHRLEIISSLCLFYSNSIIVLNDLYTAVVTVEILGTSCYTGNSSKNLIEKYLKTM